ncbi:YceI family protein [Flavobacterium sp.]|uniref:YceI family protein n=1 Tax=Flavobacterium sp. TaxID=239 RepID=UPI0026169981|nr:YceI family protein [Flavobacterium sp.]
MKNSPFLGILLVFYVLTGATSNAQTHFSIEESSDNCIEISGTSTFHDWTMETKSLSGQAQFNLLPGTDITGLTMLELSIPAKSLKSNNRALNKNAWKALKTDRFKSIAYKLVSAKITGQENYRTIITTIGKLTISGVTKEVTIDIHCMANKGGSITCTANYSFNMSDYAIDPPYFMKKLMRTGDKVALDISMRFER